MADKLTFLAILFKWLHALPKTNPHATALLPYYCLPVKSLHGSPYFDEKPFTQVFQSHHQLLMQIELFVTKRKRKYPTAL